MLPSQRSNSQPEAGIAVMVTDVPSAYLPEEGVTAPCPPPTATVRVYSAWQATDVASKSDITMVMPNTLNAFNTKHL